MGASGGPGIELELASVDRIPYPAESFDVVSTQVFEYVEDVAGALLEVRRVPRTLADVLVKTGFTPTHQQVVPILNTGYDQRTYSGGLIDIVSDFVPGHGDVTADEARDWADDLRGLGDSYFFSLNRYLFVASAL
ncbi:methyltransferase domain-containing protein [Kribbella shirazensis]|uniref:Ubiquinone/menaquinone biosynthesis C-methylase UbiE n=1 Tax=Kribbella shirazensis TaxID=1105143 RepID=A0A7X5V5N7_9ACTN|nr:methyltransferase domain-containing protein [Kribbella shirazensis]NIK55075.1 ubiquinone/menaquinone biosynthesis C-methylase UbiE [Kribbella shirazensis]